MPCRVWRYAWCLEASPEVLVFVELEADEDVEPSHSPLPLRLLGLPAAAYLADQSVQKASDLEVYSYSLRIQLRKRRQRSTRVSKSPAAIALPMSPGLFRVASHACTSALSSFSSSNLRCSSGMLPMNDRASGQTLSLSAPQPSPERAASTIAKSGALSRVVPKRPIRHKPAGEGSRRNTPRPLQTPPARVIVCPTLEPVPPQRRASWTDHMSMEAAAVEVPIAAAWSPHDSYVRGPASNSVKSREASTNSSSTAAPLLRP